MQDDFGTLIPNRRSRDTQLESLQARVVQLESSLAANTLTTLRIDANTSEIVEVFKAVKGGLKVLEALGRIVKVFLWMGALGTAISASWESVKPALSAHFPKFFQ